MRQSPDGRHLATGGPDRWIRVWEAATGRLEAAFRAHWKGVRGVKFSPDGREILSGSDDSTVRLDGANATITTTLDDEPLYEWTGPTAALSQHKAWATTEPGTLALGTHLGGWVVSEVKVKRLDAGK